MAPNRLMLFFAIGFICLAGMSCGKNNLVFGTYTEFDVAGVEAKTTGDLALKVGFDRGELAYVPDNKADGFSVLGTFDSDVKLFKGYYVKEVFATGEAANVASAGIAGETYTPSTAVRAEKSHPLLLSTGTRFGFHALFALKSGAMAPVDVRLGYKRANLAVVPTQGDALEARSVYAEILIGEGSKRSLAVKRIRNAGYDQDFSPVGNGIIISQRIATGKAAQYLAGEEKIQNKLLDLGSDLTTVNDLSDDIQEELERVNNEGKFDAAKDRLSEMSGVDSEEIASENFIQVAQATLDSDGMKDLLEFMKQL